MEGEERLPLHLYRTRRNEAWKSSERPRKNLVGSAGSFSMRLIPMRFHTRNIERLVLWRTWQISSATNGSAQLRFGDPPGSPSANVTSLAAHSCKNRSVSGTESSCRVGRYGGEMRLPSMTSGAKTTCRSPGPTRGEATGKIT